MEPLQVSESVATMSHSRALYEAAALAMLKQMARAGVDYSTLFLLKNDDELHRAVMMYLGSNSSTKLDAHG